MVTIVPAADREGASCLEYRDGGRDVRRGLLEDGRGRRRAPFVP